jgi:4-hydroxythreonine-4-phosphate dehydrogenase
MAQDTRPLLGISMGDPGGIGPEICAKALNLPEIISLCRPLVVGDAGVMADAVRFSKLNLGIHRVTAPEHGLYSYGMVDLLDLANLPMEKLRHKQVTPEQGKASFEYVAKAIELALAGRIHGTVTCPINKAALNAAGYHFAGHTEIYAELTKTKDYAMMLAEENFRVVHVSTHVSLREACERVVKARVKRVIELTADALKRLGIDSPRIGVAGLNPHCGEGGLFGYEDEQEILPAVTEARALGMQVEGPIPADTIFSKMKGGMYDAVVVMYHDQGHIPTKLVGFQYDDKTGAWGQLSGVNVTLGLPIIRTSVDHGTAFGKAGEGRANPQSLIEAIRMAAHLAKVRPA